MNDGSSRPADLQARLVTYSQAVLYPALPFVLMLLVWEVCARAGLVPPYIMPAPTAIWTRAVGTAGLLWQATLVTGFEIIAGFLISVVVGVMLAALIVFVRTADRILYPWLVFIQVIPKVAVGPLLVVWLGFGLGPKVLLAFLLSFFPILISAIVGLRSIERDSLFLLRSMGAGRLGILRYLQLPSALPVILSSLKVAITLATVGAVVGEFIGADAGLGQVLVTANGMLDTTLIFVALAWISALSLLLYATVAALERGLVGWHASQRGASALAAS